MTGPARAAGASTGGAVLEISGLCVEYGSAQHATRAVVDVDLVLHRGEVVGLAGESGSGKSTLAYAATRLLRPPGIITDGTVLFHPDPDQPHLTIDLLEAGIEALRRLRWQQLAIVLQSAMNALNPVLSVETQLTDTLAAHQAGSTRAGRRDRAAELLSMVGISPDRLRSYPHELSGGMKQRVMIAMALALEPQIVIMDEPTTALDVVTQREILEQIIELRDRLGFSVLFITHDLSLLLELADTIAVMYAGRVVESAAAGQLLAAPRHPYSAGLLASFPALHGERRLLTGIPGSPPDLRDPPPGCPFHPRCGFAEPECWQAMPPLAPPADAPPTSPSLLSPPTSPSLLSPPTSPSLLSPPTSPSLLAGDRLVACWLQDGQHDRPDEISRPEPPARPPGPVATTSQGPVQP
jgi:peptide/nickel transport system ATP-binding protein